MIKGVIFDMDGVLIDSEPFWKEAEIKTFKTIGIDMTIEMCNLTMGYRTSEVIEYWYEKTPWNGKSLKEVEDELINRVIAEIDARGEMLPGVASTLQFLHDRDVPIALASSSPMRIINKVIEKLSIKKYFKVIESAEKLEFGKPHPAVFLTAARKLALNPNHCLVIEDSVNGVIAGKAAKMQVIAVPDSTLFDDPRFIIADLKLESLLKFPALFIDKYQH